MVCVYVWKNQSFVFRDSFLFNTRRFNRFKTTKQNCAYRHNPTLPGELPRRHFTGAWDCLTYTVKTEGVRSLYRVRTKRSAFSRCMQTGFRFDLFFVFLPSLAEPLLLARTMFVWSICLSHRVLCHLLAVRWWKMRCCSSCTSRRDSFWLTDQRTTSLRWRTSLKRAPSLALARQWCSRQSV